MFDEGQATVLVNEVAVEAFIETPGAEQTVFRLDTPESRLKRRARGIWRFAERARMHSFNSKERPNPSPIPEIYPNPQKYFPNVINAFGGV